MLKSLTLLGLSILLSISIMAPSFLTLISNTSEIEMVSDFEEDGKKETKKELEEEETVKIITNDLDPILCHISQKTFTPYFYLSSTYIRYGEVHRPPPRYQMH